MPHGVPCSLGTQYLIVHWISASEGDRMTYNDLVKIAIDTRQRLESYEKRTIGKTWGNEELLIGLVTDVGDLARLVLAKEGFRAAGPDIDKALRHELADCLWATIVLAEKYNINLADALVEMSEEIGEKLEGES